MNTNNFNELILNSEFNEWYNTQELEFKLPHLNFNHTFKSIPSFHKFLNEQIEGWNKIENESPSELLKGRELFVQYINELEGLNNENLNSTEKKTNKWVKTKAIIDQSNLNNKPFIFNSSETQFLINLANLNHELFLGGFYYFVGNFSNLQNIKERISGYIHTSIKFSTYNNQSENSEQHVTTLRDEFNKNKLLLVDETQKFIGDFFQRINGDFTHKLFEHEQRINTFQKDIDEWYKNTQNNFTAFNNGSIKNINELEKTYTEKLRLEKPADYWKQRASDLKVEAKKTLNWLIGLVLFACTCLYLLLWQTPEGMLKSFFNGDGSSALRWSVVFITFISFLFFGIRTLMKITFSSFHLSRDAEERERLTYVYLAMVKDSSMEKEDRSLVLQSLFSRADTGLLKEDSSPTMPSGFIDKMTKS